MTVVIEITDDSGAVQETLEIPLVDVQDFLDQLPDGWVGDRIDGLEDDDTPWSSCGTFEDLRRTEQYE